MTELPTTFGKYFLTEKLAIGGMAEIYLAKLVGPGGFEKQLVIKQIHPKLTGQRHFVDLFVAEAKTLVTLAHGNIVPVYELGVIDDRYFIAMEYIDGPTLYRLTEALARRDQVMEPAVAAWIAAKILEGLDYAHRKGEGVIHRDLSPRNVMLSRDGEVKLVDFGIAVTLGAADDGVEVQSAPTGSFPYMSPEQVRREPLTGQTDLFSVGVLLWEMLVGQRLFARPDPDATLAAVTDEEIVRPTSQRPEIPAKLEEVVMRALERDQTVRWTSAADMLAALQRYLYSLEATPGPREVGALVARYCPPETRRMPTHADADPVLTEDGTPPPPGPAGPRTAVIERDAVPRGKQRARTETFATHVDLKHILERATPLFPIPAIVDDEPGSPQTRPASRPADDTDEPSSVRDGDKPARARSNPRMASVRPDTDEPLARSSARLRSVHPERPAELVGPTLPGRLPPSRALILVAALGTIALGIAAVYVFMRGRTAVMRPDAMPKYDAAGYSLEFDAAMPDAMGTQPDAAEPDVAAPIDARVTDLARDAGARPKPDGRTSADAATPVVTGKAKLSIGANPWGEIVIDGIRYPKLTPQLIEVTAGKHLVEVIFRPEGEDPQKKTFNVNVGAGETLPLNADFTK